MLDNILPEVSVGDGVGVYVEGFDLGLLYRVLAAVRLGVVNPGQELPSLDDLHVVQVVILVYN